jgi:alkylation response protein AidB-like acyl-CoA dehydrogenase
MSDNNIPLGGEFLLIPGKPEHCFVPEEFTEEHRMIYKTCADFIKGEIWPNDAKIEKKDHEVVKKLMAAAGELGLLGTDVPEAYGGLGLDKASTALVTEAFGTAGSLAVAQGAHTGIGTMPIVIYGTKEQKEKYLPGSASGENIHAFCLTESGAGSDAIGGCRTKAVLSDDGKHYIINGSKQWITNGGWASVFVVFAKVDDQFTAFIVERDTPGVTAEAEEEKMGIKGSSTTTVILEDVKVPVENLLGEIGMGHFPAMNPLSIGRYKLGAAAIGGSKLALGQATKYAAERAQFGKNIIEYGAIREKMARIAMKCYMGESVIYRNVGLLQDALHDIDPTAEDYPERCTEVIREYAIECAISKVHGSEVLDYTVDEFVQILGGYGYVSEYPAERAFRDARINRIFEGTNEVNRLLIPAEIIKKAMKGKLPFMAAGQKLMGEIMEYSPLMVELPDEPLAYQEHMVEMCKKAVIFVAGTAMQKLMQKLSNEQEILMRCADMIIEIFAMEAGVIRAKKAIAAKGEEKAQFHMDAVKAYVDEMIPKIDQWAKECLCYLEEGDDLRSLLVGIRKLLKYNPENGIALRKAIADKVVEKNGYPLDY